jgi:hypothetical protein
MELFQKIRFRAKRVEPAPVSQMEQRSARLIQRAWRRRRFFEKHGESILSRWLNIVQGERGCEVELFYRQKKTLRAQLGFF